MCGTYNCNRAQSRAALGKGQMLCPSAPGPCYQAVVTPGPLVSISRQYWSCSASGRCRSGPRPQATSCQRARDSEALQPVVGGVAVLSWRMRSEASCLAFSLGPSSSAGLGPAVSWGPQGTGWGLCPAGLQGPRRGRRPRPRP